MKSQVDEIALQGIEFWSTVCDEEQDLAIEAAEVIPHIKACVNCCVNCCVTWLVYRQLILADNQNRIVSTM